MTRLRDTVVWTVAAIAIAAGMEVLLRTTTLPRTAHLLNVVIKSDVPAAPFRTEEMPRWSQARLAAVDVAVRHWPFGDTCLRRALLTAVVLRPLHPVVRIGWLPTPAGGNAHAWVEVAGRSLDAGLDGIEPFVTR